MDVRCEKCLTEYELDETRLKPGGVTVKCTNCGHMFKIRKRAATNVGSPAPRAQSSRPGSVSGAPRAPTNDPDSGPMSERLWMIRLDNGETRTCRELGTLQQWILAGLVTRESLISRSGKTWKRLGDIGELASFFQVADESRVQRTREPGRVPTPQPRVEPAATPPTKATMLGMPAPREEATSPAIPALRPPTAPATHQTLIGTAAGPLGRPVHPSAQTPPGPPTATSTAPTAPPAPVRPQTPPPVDPGRAATVPAHAVSPRQASATPPTPPAGAPALRPGGPPPSRRAESPAGPVGGTPAARPSTGAWANHEIKAPPSTGAWAAHDIAPPSTGELGPRGPVAGAVRPYAADPVFAGIPHGAPGDDGGFGADRIPGTVEAEDTSPVFAPRSGIGKWLAIGSVAVIGVAALVVYLTAFRSGGGAAAAGAGTGTGSAAADAGAVAVVTPPDAAAPAVDPLAPGKEALLTDTPSTMAAASAAIATDPSPAASALQARLATAIAQALDDQAALTADTAQADALRRESRQKLLEAIKPAQRALRDAPDQVLAQVAMADLLRLQGKPTQDVRRYLDRALALSNDDRDARLVGALVDLRDGKTAQARAALEALDRGPGSLEQSGDVRARFRLAMLARGTGDTGAARAAAEAVLAVASEHVGARALVGRLGDATVDPLPPEEGTAGTAPAGGGAAPAAGGGGGGGGGDPYDRALAQAQKLAEVDCKKAMPLYEKAIDLRPNGVEALTGAAYCHIDAKQFASAQDKFRAALGVSPRFERALWGVAEAYQQQGRKDDAIEAYKHYLEVYPGSAAAKKQLDRLGASEGDTTAPAPAPAPTPPPAGGGDEGAAPAGSNPGAAPANPDDPFGGK